MIYGVGIDLCSCQRIENLLEQKEQLFLDKVLTLKEQQYFNSCRSKKRRLDFFSGRWSAKEALAKALKVGIGEHCRFLDIEVLNDSFGVPLLSIKKNTPTRTYLSKILNDSFVIHISITHELNFAQAFVIIENTGN